LLLSLILAHAALVARLRGAPPILLLDEVAAHLDPDRRAALFERLADTGSQVWMTGTEASLFDSAGADAMHVQVADGALG
jgi:DNA replication and repair protein RecF